MRVTCSVVTGTNPDAIVDFLKSLRVSADIARDALSDLSLEITVIVNDPDARQQEWWSLADTLIVNSQPRGFAFNHNRVLERSPADYHVIANDDVVVTAPAMMSLLTRMDDPRNADVGALSPLLLNPDGTLQPSTYSFPTVPSVLFNWTGLRRLLPDAAVRKLASTVRRQEGTSRMWSHAREVDVDTFRGAFVLMRMSAVRQVGLMTEVARVGCEEVEWHRRLEDAGWRRLFTPAATVIHVGQLTTGGRRDLEIEYIKGTANFFATHSSRWRFEVVKVAAIARTSYLRARHRATERSAMPLYGSSVTKLKFGGVAPPQMRADQETTDSST
jgi:GT2 family glycosyltransferase